MPGNPVEYLKADCRPLPEGGATFKLAGGARLCVPPRGSLTVYEAALILGVSSVWVYELLERRELRERGTGARRIPLCDVKRVLRARRRQRR